MVAPGPTADDGDSIALRLLARLLGGNSSPLRSEVRVERGAAYTFGATYRRWRTASGVDVGGAFAPDKVMASLSTILATIAERRSHEASEADLERARANIVGDLRDELSSTVSLARGLPRCSRAASRSPPSRHGASRP